MYLTLIWLVTFSLLVHGKPLELIKNDPEYTADGFEGDMILNEVQKNALLNPMQARNGLVAETKRWPNREVIYKIVGDFDEAHQKAIRIAIATLESRTCIRFRVADDTDTAYVAITSKPGGCFTAVGYQARSQEMNLENYPVGEGCFRPGTILHEFMHALGFYHQQSAADRDEFVQVLYENITPGKEFNFKKYSPEVVTDFGVGYDYDSCLHYRPGAFSKNGENTIIPLNREAKIGQRTGLSKRDIDKINVMYKCTIKI